MFPIFMATAGQFDDASLAVSAWPLIQGYRLSPGAAADVGNDDNPAATPDWTDRV